MSRDAAASLSRVEGRQPRPDGVGPPAASLLAAQPVAALRTVARHLGVVDRLVNVVGHVMSLNGKFLSYVQTGYVRTYALTLVGGAVIMLLVLL